MKKIIVGLAVVLLLQAAAMAQTQVLSRNAVGYVKITAERGKLVLGRLDFEAIGGGGIAVSNLFGDQLPANSQVYLWDRASAQYKTCFKAARGGWSGGSNIVTRGEGFWVRVPAAAASNAYDVFLMGEVPDRFTAPTTTIANLSGANMLGYPYPVQRYWTNTTLANEAPANASLYLWNATNQAYEVHTKTIRGGWATATNVILHPGVGFWLRNTGTVTWVELKPYTWP